MSGASDVDVFDIPPYPDEWTAEQRVSAYWHALNFTNIPSRTEDWWTVWKSMHREESRRNRAIQAAAVQEQEKPQP